MATVDLFSPLVFRNGARAPNRLALAPMTNGQSHADGSLSDDELRFLNLRAEGGFGVIETCASHISLDGQGWEGELGIFDDKLLPGLSRLAKALRERSATSIVQIFHGGARANRTLIGGRPLSAGGRPLSAGGRPLSASELPGDPAEPREATPAEIERVIADFAAAAARAHKAGFDGVELHGAHGYLLCQFLSRHTNRREDAYGGSLEGRARLLREATRAARAAVPSSFIVGVRISPENFGNLKGLDLDESLKLAQWLCDDGVDFLHISLWNAFHNTHKRPDEHPIPLFRRATASDVPLFVAGSIWTRYEAESLLELGADAIALGRAAIANPDWPNQARKPGYQPKKPPLSPDELRERGLNESFVNYMRRWKGFVSE